MGTNKNVIVVAPDKYKRLARNLSHEIAKREQLDSVYWSLNLYQSNEFKQSGNQYVLFIGNPDENEFTADYLETIKPKKEAGHCFGYSGSKAIAYGEGIIDDIEEVKEYWKSIINVPVYSGIGAAIAASSIFTIIITPAIITIIYFLLSKRKKKKHLLKTQTKAAVKSFLIHDFDDWLGINTKDK